MLELESDTGDYMGSCTKHLSALWL